MAFDMMNRSSLLAVLIAGFPLWIAGAVGNLAVAGDHYRVGTLNESYHYRDNEEFNSTHNGIYLMHNRNVFGAYNNSEDEPSFFFARSHPINQYLSYSYGVAVGYNAGMVPMVALSAQVSMLKLTMTHEAAVIGVEFPVY